MDLKLNEQIARMRMEKNMSQEELAQKLDVTQQTVSNWESGDTVPDANVTAKLAGLFNVSMDELVLGKKDSSVNREERTHYGSEIHNGWEFLARYWWIVFALIGLIGWLVSRFIR